MVDIGSMTRKMKDYGKTMVDRALIDKDLSIGKRMQTLLLPPKRGMTETWRWRTTYCPSMTLAGDWFDVRRIRTSNGRDYLLCCVVDVTGHGVSSALISTAISSHWSMWCEGRDGGLGPESDREREKLILEAPNHIHRGLATLREASGCTAAFMILDESSNRLSYCTAGHPGIIFISSVGEMRYLFTPGTRPGFTDSAVGWTARSTEANVGDMFFLYSDGVVPSDLPFSVWLKKLGGRDRSGTDAVAKSLLEDIRRNKSQFRKNRHQEDDMSLVMLKRIA
jgi:sigma-B regulation protein RsbU (phosphoserine phosphatase)